MKNYLIVLLSLILFNSCKKSDSTPKPTQNGANTLWYKLNGQTHSYEGKPNYYNETGVQILGRDLVDGTKGFLILANNKIKYDEVILLYISMGGTTDSSIKTKYPSINTSYKLSDNHYVHTRYNKGTDEYFADTSNSTIVFTRFDDEVAAGTFEFHGFNYDNKPITITEGFFDISRK